MRQYGRRRESIHSRPRSAKGKFLSMVSSICFGIAMAPTILKNPFVVGGALSDASGRGFFGRDDIFDFVLSALMVERRIPILLHGQRRIGKSSILKQLPRHLPPDFADRKDGGERTTV